MRGKAEGKAEIARTLRITPAYAGKRNSARTWSSVRQDHPRVCGEKSSMSRLFSLYSGSPPRMRGKGLMTNLTNLKARITPAYAGKRLWGNNRGGRNEDRPRVCGEKFIRLALPDLHRGSPPRMRGKEPLRAVTICCVRITPAYAGKRRKSL